MILLLQIKDFTPLAFGLGYFISIIPSIAVARWIMGIILRKSNIFGDEKTDKQLYMDGNIHFYSHREGETDRLTPDYIHNPRLMSNRAKQKKTSSSQLKHKRPNYRAAAVKDSETN